MLRRLPWSPQRRVSGQFCVLGGWVLWYYVIPTIRRLSMMHRDIPIVLWAILLCGCHAEQGDMKHSIGESHPIETNAEEEKTDASASDENKPRETPKAATSQKGKPSREAVAGPPERISAHLPNLPPENRCFTVDDLPKLPEPSSLSNISQTDSTRRHHSKGHERYGISP